MASLTPTARMPIALAPASKYPFSVLRLLNIDCTPPCSCPCQATDAAKLGLVLSPNPPVHYCAPTQFRLFPSWQREIVSATAKNCIAYSIVKLLPTGHLL